MTASSQPPFPAARPRRLRQSAWVRSLVREVQLAASDLIWALVVHDGPEDEVPVSAMPGAPRLSPKAAAAAAKALAARGLTAIAIFPHIDPAKKTSEGAEAFNPDGLVCRTLKAIKDAAPEIGLMADVALDPFTDHGHDGLMDARGRIINDPTLEALQRQALVQARAGADIIAPSDMMDGRVGAIRGALEAEGFADTLIMSYAAKYASCFYGPYREAIGSAKALKGDKQTYQMDYANSDEALREAAMDVAEGADMLLVKPGLAYLDIVRRLKDAFALPTYAFQVSGEYAMVKAASAHGWLDEDKAIVETLTAFRRAGADGVVTYFAPRALDLIGA